MKLTIWKKIALYAALLALVLSLGTVFASADYADYPVYWTEGCFAGADGAAFTPVGDVQITWYPYLGEKLNLADGDLTDWREHQIPSYTITPDHMISWIGGQAGVLDPGMPAGWQITAYYAADSTNLYVAFDVVDDNHVYCEDAASYTMGDAIQLAVDFGGKLGDVMETDPDRLSNFKDIFYSFSCQSDGAPLGIMRQESDQDGLLTEANGDGVKGAARRTDTGWSAELALSWELLYNDYIWKSWEYDPKIYVFPDQPLKVGVCLSYVNRDETGEISWAACTGKGYMLESGAPGVSWTPLDNGVNLYLPYSPEMSFECGDIIVREGCETTATHDCTEPPETEPVIEPVTEPATEWESILDSWIESLPDEFVTVPDAYIESASEILEELPIETPESALPEDEIQAILEKYGCTSLVGTSALALLLTLAAAAYALRRKH